MAIASSVWATARRRTASTRASSGSAAFVALAAARLTSAAGIPGRTGAAAPPTSPAAAIRSRTHEHPAGSSPCRQSSPRRSRICRSPRLASLSAAASRTMLSWVTSRRVRQRLTVSLSQAGSGAVKDSLATAAAGAESRRSTARPGRRGPAPGTLDERPAADSSCGGLVAANHQARQTSNKPPPSAAANQAGLRALRAI